MFVYAKYLQTALLQVTSLLFGGAVMYTSLSAGEYGLQLLDGSLASSPGNWASWFGLARGALLIDSAFQQVTKTVLNNEHIVHIPVNVTSEVFNNNTLVWTSKAAADIRPGVLSAVNVLEVAVPTVNLITLSKNTSPVKAGVFDIVPQICAKKIGGKVTNNNINGGSEVRKVAPKYKKTTLDFAATTCKAQNRPFLALELDAVIASISPRSTRTTPSTQVPTSSALIVLDTNTKTDARRLRAIVDRLRVMMPILINILYTLVCLYALQIILRGVFSAFYGTLELIYLNLVFTPRVDIDEIVFRKLTPSELLWLTMGVAHTEGDDFIPESYWTSYVLMPVERYETVVVDNSKKMDQSFFNVFVLLNAYILMQQRAALTKRDVRRADVLFFASLCNPIWVQITVASMGHNYHYTPRSAMSSSESATVEGPSPGLSSRSDTDTRNLKRTQREHDDADKRLQPDERVVVVDSEDRRHVPPVVPSFPARISL